MHRVSDGAWMNILFFFQLCSLHHTHAQNRDIIRSLDNLFFDSSEADVCDRSLLIGQLAAVFDASSGSGMPGEEGD